MSSSPKPSSHPVPTHPVHKVLATIHPPDTAAAIFDKTRQKPLLLRPGVPSGFNGSATATTGGNDKRSLRRHIRLRKKQYYLRKQKPQPLSAREKRELGIYGLDRRKGQCQYKVYQGLNRLWCGYMVEVLGLGSNNNNNQLQDPNQRNKSTVANRHQKQHQIQNQNTTTHHPGKTITATSHGSLLASADFHGAEVEVVRCQCVDRVGIRGIVVRDTKFTFVVVTRKNEVKVVPKRGAVFRYFVPVPAPSTSVAAESGAGPPRTGSAEGQEQQEQREQKMLVFEVHGSQIEVRPAERATRKFKWKAMDYL